MLTTTSAGPSEPSLGPVQITTGGTAIHTFDRQHALPQKPVLNLPLTAADAVAAGREDPFLCSAGRGRYFQKVGGGEVPYVLAYDSAASVGA